LNGDGEPVDWVVQMQRLPANNALDVILRERRLTARHTRTIAQHLTSFYIQLLPKPLSSAAYREALERHIRANTSALLDTLNEERTRIRRIQSAQLRFLHVERDLVGSRATAGHVVDGHGDLRPEHIYLNGRLTVIDCVEFSDELRTVDIADELSFLGMECQRLGDGGLGEQILEDYERASSDHIPVSLLSFYRCYRAAVRAKVALIREQQQAVSTESKFKDLAREYIALADEHAKQLGPPVLLIFGGLMGCGKSTLAANFADAFGIELVSTDHIRRSLIGSSDAPAKYGDGNYQPDMRTRIYDNVFCRADERLRDGESAILDGTFLTCCLRDRAYELASRHGAVALYVQCTCPRVVAYARIQKRSDSGQSESEARTELYDLQARDVELPWADEPAISVDTTATLEKQFRHVCDKLKEL
jgi:aminoglycoside phosphotransferase family enzyme/predicted kinase